MAHIPDGVLSTPILAAGALVSLAGIGIGLRRLEPEVLPRVGVLSAAFFVASLVHLPAGLSSVHLILNGLMGILLGWAAFPAIAVALLLQAVLFGYGGLVVLGVNVMNMAVPALLAGLAFRLPLPRPVAGTLAGGGAILLTALMVSASLGLSGKEFIPATKLVVLTALPLMVVEAVVTGALVGLLARVKPEVLARRLALAALLACTLVLPAQAHKLKLFVQQEGGELSGHAYFANGGPAMDVAGEIRDGNGAVLGGFRTDGDGHFRVTAPAAAAVAAVDAGDGHVAQARLGGTPAAEPAPANDNAAMEAAIARQLRPLREQLDEIKARTRAADIVGGVGIIFGIFGCFAWLAARKGGKKA